MRKIIISAVFIIAAISVAWAADSIAPSAETVRPLLIGAQAPEAALRKVDGSSVNFSAVLAGRPTVVIFYRGGWCPYCNLHLQELKGAEPELIKLGYQLVALSADKPEELAKTIKKHELKYTLLSDSRMQAASAFGIAYKVDDAMLQKYTKYGIDLERASGEKDHVLPVPSVFIIGKDGTIQFEYVNPNYKVRLKADVLIAAAKAYRQ